MYAASEQVAGRSWKRSAIVLCAKVTGKNAGGTCRREGGF